MPSAPLALGALHAHIVPNLSSGGSVRDDLTNWLTGQLPGHVITTLRAAADELER